MDQHVLNFLTLWSRADLVKLIKHENHTHALGIHKGVRNLARMRGLIDKLVARVSRRIRVTTEGDKLEGPVECLRNAILDQTGLSNTRGS